MHNAALHAVGLDSWRYQLLPLPPELLAEAVRALPGVGFAAINVTIPHKEAALALADEATASARAIGAANTLTFAAGAIHADNTDAPGLIAALGDEQPRTALVLAPSSTRWHSRASRSRSGTGRQSARAAWRSNSAPKRCKTCRRPTCWSTAPRSASPIR
jgi:Shikimate dehydrogenase substrate binding domain